MEKIQLIKEVNQLINEKSRKNEINYYLKNNIYGCVYLLINKEENKPYIGIILQKTTFSRRFITHVGIAKNFMKYNKKMSKIKNIFYKYSKKEDWNYAIIDIAFSKEELNKLEKKYIQKYNSIKNGYNEVYGGRGGCLGYKHTLEDKQKISYNNHIREVSEETKRKIGNANKGKFNKSPLCKKIDVHINNVFVKTFPSIMEIIRFFELSKTNESTIRKILHKQGKTLKKVLTFAYNKETKIQTLTDEQIKNTFKSLTSRPT